MRLACTSLYLRSVLAASALAICFVRTSMAANYYVDPAGTENATGLTPESALSSITKAAELAKPGDTVLLAPGIYFENVLVKNAGLSGQPITFRADKSKPGSVIISGADPKIREKKVSWELVDESLALYAVAYSEKPARVLYDNVDLLPYPSLANLKTFRFDNGMPGTRHGFAFENGRLYVRLHPDGIYGSPDPQSHVMAVSPAGSPGKGASVDILKPRDSIWRIETGAASHIVVDGFTFETPGIAAIYAPDGDVVVRNCRFLGCRSGVSGRTEVQDATKNTGRVTIENCDYTQLPAFDDMLEVIKLHSDDPWRGDRRKIEQRIFWWQRKGDQKEGGIGYSNTYETGIATNIGNDWIIRRNHIHDALEALSMWGTDHSNGLQVYENRIERLIDNAVECENRSVGLSFHHNVLVDVFEPFSWQPLRATPWPGPAYIYSNLVLTTPPLRGVWKNAGHTPGVWKLGASESNWKRKDIVLAPNEPVRAGGEGFISYNNTIYCPGSVAITRVQNESRDLENFFIFNNLFVLDDISVPTVTRFSNIQFASNIGTYLKPQHGSAPDFFTANGGQLLEGAAADAIWINVEKGEFLLRDESPAKGRRRPDSPATAYPDAGAFPLKHPWKLPPVGPKP